MQPRSRAKNWVVCVCIIRILCCSFPISAQFTSYINCIFPAGLEGKEVKLIVKPLAASPLIDTATVVDQRAIFNVYLAEPAVAYIWVEGHKEDINFLIDSPQLTITIAPQDSGQALISGSPSGLIWRQQQAILAQLRESQAEIRTASLGSPSLNDSLSAEKSEQLVDSLATAYDDRVVRLINENLQAIASWHLFSTHYSSLPYIAAAQLLNNLASFRTYPSYKRVATELYKKRLGINATDFTLTTLSVDAVTLSKLKSKFILIDFSDSFMSACQQRHKALKKLYTTYHPLGFDILTISLNFGERTEKQALQQENLPWPVALDEVKTPNVADMYAIGSVPDNVLLDDRKTIVGRDLSPQALENLLKNRLKKAD